MSASFTVYTSNDVMGSEDGIRYDVDELPEALERFFNAVTEGEFARLDYSS